MHTNKDDLIDLNRRATLSCIDLVARVRPDDLRRPTPCAEWDLSDLLAHMTVQHRGFAAAAAGDGKDFDWTPRRLAPDFADAYAAAANEALKAFDQPGALERAFVLPEIPSADSFPGTQAVSFHFIDALVHGWDVARSIDAAYDIPADFAALAVRIARAVPGGPYRERPNASFGPAVELADGASPLDTVLCALGRSPRWPKGQGVVW
ncbi:TIGR03086 family protein [Actinospica sp. MGRD01-02]|uniref:TIGR03086 family protein n=1 Tax=Actinospica acidithermotolerans TaxID=2828514 RepID=A0A941EF74_9ACTN|nr:TIGR03086 family metal-binding protein [Actinospica acidithermotolerans]MBR7830282.1 TIGR03086 family protein [Actinospica acidithermotolerans]